jgi:hypothetical protein
MKRLIVCALGLMFLADNTRAADAVAAPLQATLRATEGSVLVNQGEQFVELPIGTLLKPGDRIMSMDDSKAFIRYFDDCEVEVEEGDVYTIDERLPCPCLDFEDEKDPVATLIESTGPISLQQGEVDYPITAGQMLHVGDLVRVAEEATALFEYRDGCQEEINENNDFEIPDESPCMCAALIFDKVKPITGNVLPRVIIPSIIVGCLAYDNSDPVFDCVDRPASP